jgi:hypothetical protein
VVQTVRGIVNPDKLQHLGTVSDMARIRAHERDDHTGPDVTRRKEETDD